VSPDRADGGLHGAVNDPHGERRNGGRRRSDRPAAPGRRSSDSLAAADGDTGVDSLFDPGWLAAGDVPADNPTRARRTEQQRLAETSASARVFRTYTAARAAIGVGLVAAQAAGNLLASGHAGLITLLCVAYGVQAVTLWLLPRFGQLALPQTARMQRRRQWLLTIGVDLLVFSSMHLLAVGASFSYAALLVLPVLMAGVLTQRLLALGTAAGVALMLLAAAWPASVAGADAAAVLLQSGLGGLGLFVIVLVAGELAGRLATQEQAARGSFELARLQAQLNRLVIEEMADGVLVIDKQLRVRAANPAARGLLVAQGLSPPAPFRLLDRPDWQALRQAVERALTDGDWPEAGREVELHFGHGHVRTVRMRVRFMQAHALDLQGDETEPDTGAAIGSGAPLGVLLLEDVRTAQARLRQEKLAAMGRVSAGIAHEIRNPLAAISQANALLLEDGLAPPQQRLLQIVADNVARLKRLVDDVMELAPGGAPAAQGIDATAVVAAAVADWAVTVQLPAGQAAQLRCDFVAAPLPVSFDAEHLRRVLVNLLENALRHASGGPASVRVRVAARNDGGADLSVLSDGPPIAPEVERYLFEPFFSTRSRGTGLGLYICRELCERYAAQIEYRLRPATESLRNEFVVHMRREPPADLQPPSSPTP
jgi:two-component system, NtrC family, sensor histidine kinase PilS